MTPDERLQRIAEQQRELRSRLSELERELDEVRFALQEQKKTPVANLDEATKTPSAPATTAQRPLAVPPPLPKAVAVPAVAKLESQEPVMRQVSAEVKASNPQPKEAVPAIPKGDFEMRMGKVWFVRIGIVAILTGIALGSVYAYQNFVRDTPPIIKVLALYAVSGFLAGIGLWLERSRESLKTFGRVVTAGGFAAIFYTTYAMHYVEGLRVIESPVLAGVALLICALGIFIYSDRRKDQTVAAMSLVLGYYGTVINAIGWFSLFSNLVLTCGGLWLLWRHRWMTLGILSLIGSYGGFAFWQYALPFVTTGSLAPMAYWAGQGFLISCWLLFTAVFLLAKSEAMNMTWRGTLSAFNNSAFFTLFAIALIFRTEKDSRTDAFAVFAITWGVVLLLLCWLAEKRHPEKGRALGEMFLAFGLVQISLGLAVKLTGYNLATAFAFQAVVLAWLGNRQNRIVAKLGAAVSALLVLMLPLWLVPGNAEFLSQTAMSEHGFPTDAIKWPVLSGKEMLAVIIQVILLVVGGWFARKTVLPGKDKPALSVLGLWLCLTAVLTAYSRLTVPGRELNELFQALAIAAIFILAGSERILRFAELRRVGTLAGVICATLILVRSFVPHPTDAAFFNIFTISICAVALLALAWIARRDAWLKISLLGVAEAMSLEVFIFGAVAWLSWARVVVLPIQQWWDAPVLIITSGALYLLGSSKKTGLLELSLVARLAAMASAVLILIAAIDHRAQSLTGLDYLGVSATSILLIIAAWLARHKPAFPWSPIKTGLGFTPALHASAAVGSFVLQTFWPFRETWQPGGWIVICAIMMALSKVRKVNLPELGMIAGVFALFMSYYQITTLLTSSDRLADGGLLLAFIVLMLAAAMPAPAWLEKERWLSFLRWTAGLQTTFSYLHWWLAHEPMYFSLATAAVGLLLAALAKWKKVNVTAGFAWLMIVLSLLSFLADTYGIGPEQQWWGWIVPVSIMAAEWMLRRSEVYTERLRKTFNNIIALAAVFALWSFITFHVLADGEFRTIAWAVLSLLIFVAGILMGHPVYRRCGLAILAVALGRILFYDVWQLETAGRFISFLAIGAVLVLLGFFYNRFEDFIRKYL